MKYLLDAFYLLGALAYSPVMLYKVLRYKRYRSGWAHRAGRLTRRDPSKPCIWLHAVSVGEVNAARTILSELEKQSPGHEIVVSVTTDTGYARAESLYADKWEVFYYPLDLSVFVGRAFARIRPALCILMELEVWPNFLDTAHRAHIPIVVVNGRISDKSFRSYQKFRPLLAGTFGKITRALVQTQEYAERFTCLGCPADRVLVTGSLKYDTAQMTGTGKDVEVLAQRLNLRAQRLWVAGGTGNQEEEQAVLWVYQQLRRQAAFTDLRVALVPRKPERFDHVAQWIQQAGFSVERYSHFKDTNKQMQDPSAVILGDTMGDLRKFYSLAVIVFVGRSLVPLGGSDMMEAVALGKPTLFGTHTFNFKQTVDALLEGKGAIQVKDKYELLTEMSRCLAEPDRMATMAINGQNVIRAHQGATKRCVKAIVSLLPERSSEQ